MLPRLRDRASATLLRWRGAVERWLRNAGFDGARLAAVHIQPDLSGHGHRYRDRPCSALRCAPPRDVTSLVGADHCPGWRGTRRWTERLRCIVIALRRGRRRSSMARRRPNRAIRNPGSSARWLTGLGRRDQAGPSLRELTRPLDPGLWSPRRERPGLHRPCIQHADER